MKFIIASSGKYHHFNLAKSLFKKDNLSKIFTGYPWFKIKREMIPKEYVFCIGIFEVIIFFIKKISFNKLGFLYKKLIKFKKIKSDKIFLKEIKKIKYFDYFLCLSGDGLNTAKYVKTINKTYICERSSSHILYQEKILNDEYSKLGFKRKINKWIIDRELKSYELADLILVPSNFVKKTFEEYGLNNKVCVINFGANTDEFKKLNTKKETDEFNILFVGQLSIRKGLHYLTRSFKDFDHPKKKLHIVGPRTPETNLIDKFIYKENTIFYGARSKSEICKIMNTADVFVLPSLEEGMANVILEATACGLPIILTENSGGAELIENLNNGYVVPIKNSEAILEKLNLLKNRDILNNLSINSEKFFNFYNWDRYSDELKKNLQLRNL